MASWVEFWNGETPIYVNERHQRAHYRQIAEDILRNLPKPSARVLDYGCGPALSADKVADACEHLYLCDSAARVKEALKVRFRERTNVSVIAPEELDVVPNGSIDLFVVNSVVQYLSGEEFRKALPVWREKLSRDGRLLLADIIPPHIGLLTDAAALLKFAAANGFFLAACAGLVRTFFSDYRKLRARLGLQLFEEKQMLALLRNSGFAAARHFPNLGHNAQRMAFIATRAE